MWDRACVARTWGQLPCGAGLVRRLRPLVAEVTDAGDVSGPENPEHDPVQGYRHLSEVIAWNMAVYDAVQTALRGGHVPVILGGDHVVGIGSVSAVALPLSGNWAFLRVLWFDAHADFNTAASSPSANIHGMPVACLCGEGLPS